MITNKNEINVYFNKDKSNDLDESSFNILWSGYSVKENNLSILSYIEKNDIFLRDLFLNYLFEIKNNIIENNSNISKILIEKNLHIWWITKIEEKSYYKQPKLFECLKILALKKIIEDRNITKVNLFNPNIDIKNVIKEICVKKRIILKSYNQINKYNTFIILYKLLRSFYHYFKFILPRLFFIFKRNKYLNNNNQLVLFDFLNYYNYENFKDKKTYNSEYWGGLTNYLSNNNIKIAWIHTFYKNKKISNVRKAESLLNNIKDRNQEHALLDSYINFDVIFNTLLIYFKSLYFSIFTLNKKKLFFSKSININFWDILKDDFFDSFIGPDLIINSFYFFLFRNIMPKINKNINAFYICENQSIEKSLIFNWKRNSKNKVFAIQNSTVRFWDLRYAELNQKSLLQKQKFNLLYDKLLVNGEQSYDILTYNKFYLNFIGKVEAFRYELFLNQKIKLNYSNSNKKELKILIIGDASDYINSNLLNYFLKLQSTKQKFLIYFKPHPLSKIYKKNKYNKFFIENDKIINLINKYDLFITSNTTSASLDLFLLNVNVFVMLDNNIPNFSPVRNNSGVKFFNESDNFINMINENKFKSSNSISNSLYYSSNYNLFTKYIDDR